MKTLCLDTSMQACSAAVYDAARGCVLAARHELMERGHAEAIAPMIQALVEEAGKPDRIAVTLGPGTFTGVRIGLAMAKGLGLGWQVPVIGISTLEAIAANEINGLNPVLVVTDARLNEVYAALYSPQGTEIMAPLVTTPERLSSLLPHGNITVIGTAADAVIAALTRPGLTRSNRGDLPRADRFGGHVDRAAAARRPLSPLYLRPPAAVPPPPAIAIRPARDIDVDIIAALHAACFPSPWGRDELLTLMTGPGARPVLALADGHPAGFALLRRAADEAEILTIGTSPAHRRQGIAKAMIAEEAEALASQGVRSLFIEVAASNEAGQALYKSCGFEGAGRRRAYYQHTDGSREDAVVMRKVLAT
jgi:tRNA threonylcarbamoyladenosine biosynthesis protein TsaB